jgi:hypothetical protein
VEEAIVPSSRPGRGGGAFQRKTNPPSRESKDVGNDKRSTGRKERSAAVSK